MTVVDESVAVLDDKTLTAKPVLRRARRLPKDIGVIIPLGVFGFLTFMPLLMLVQLSFKSEQQLAEHMWLPALPLHFENYVGGWYAINPFLMNSLIFVIGTVIVSFVFSVMSSYALARYQFPGREFFYMAILGLMMVPGILTLLTRFLIVVKLGLNNSFWGLWLPMAAGAQAFQIIVLRTFIASIPEDFFEAARLDGAGELVMLWHIALPLGKPIITTLMVLQANNVWNEFLWPVMVMADPHRLPAVVQILQFVDRTTSRFDPGIEKASYVITGLPVLLLFAFTSRAFIRGLTSGAIKM